MVSMVLKIDKKVYTEACISKAVYSLSKDYAICRSQEQDSEIISVVPWDNQKDENQIKADIFNALNDYQLRQIIEDETHDIRTILYAKAFADFEDIDSDDEV